jgi:hypothetical protein
MSFGHRPDLDDGVRERGRALTDLVVGPVILSKLQEIAVNQQDIMLLEARSLSPFSQPGPFETLLFKPLVSNVRLPNV